MDGFDLLKMIFIPSKTADRRNDSEINVDLQSDNTSDSERRVSIVWVHFRHKCDLIIQGLAL